jgi:hypothetical protein
MDKINKLEEIIQKFTIYQFYIGQTVNPKIRLKQHFKSKNFKLMIVLFKSDSETIDFLEHYLINKFKNNQNNMNNQIYENNEKDLANLSDLSNIDELFPDENEINPENIDYLYISFPILIDKIDKNLDYFDILTITNNNKVISQKNYKYKIKSNKIKKTPFTICKDKINTLLKQYSFKYSKCYIKSSKNYQIRKLKILKHNKDYLIKQIYRNNDYELIHELIKKLQISTYDGSIKIKKNNIFQRLKKKDKNCIYIILK